MKAEGTYTLKYNMELKIVQQLTHLNLEVLQEKPGTTSGTVI